MSTAAKYRGFAADCHRFARLLVIEIDDRVLLLDMAEEWLRLADRAEGKSDDPRPVG
jgi:hypothetical protein